MSGFAVSMKMEVKQLQKELKAIEKEVKKATRRGVTKATRVVRVEIKRRTPKDQGETRRRVDMVVRTYKNGVVVGVVGIRKGPTIQVPVKKVFRFVGNKVAMFKKPKPEFKSKRHNPQYIWHLLELGFTRKDGRRFPAVAMVRRGFEAKKAEAESIVANEINGVLK